MKSPGHLGSTAPEAVGEPAEDDCDPFQWDTREDCEVRQILDRVADKWSLLVIALLERRTLRFNELRRTIDGISQRMLTVTLRQLERDGLVRRTVHPVVPPRVDYQLTDLGCSLHETIHALVTWTEAHQAEIAAARTAFDQHVADPAAAGSADSDRRGSARAGYSEFLSRSARKRSNSAAISSALGTWSMP